MSWPAHSVRPSASLSAALDLMATRGVRHLLVAASGGLSLGVLCEVDAAAGDPHAPAVAAITSAPTIAATSPLQHAVWLLSTSDACSALVFVRGKPSGILTRGDLCRAGLAPASWPRCVACRDHHRLVDRAGVRFCAACAAHPRATTIDQMYVDLGGGD